IGYARVTVMGTILELNHAGALILGHPRGELIGRPIGSLFTVETRSELQSALAKAAGGGTSHQTEMRLVREPQTRLFFHAAIMPGEEGALLVAFYDVTERLNREDQLVQSELDLRDADRRKDDFLAAVSHEMRNPLAAIRSAVQLQLAVEPGGKA